MEPKPRSESSVAGMVASIFLILFVARVAWLWIAHVGCEKTWDDGAVQLARDVHYYSLGSPLYIDFRRPPYYAQEYGPTTPFVVKPLTRFFGSSIFACLRIGRWVTILSTFATCFAIALLAGQFSSIWAAAIAAMGFALTPVFVPWFAEFRVDMLALFFELLGLYSFSRGAGFLALVILLVAFLTKETYVGGIVAIVGLCWYRGEHARALKLAIGWVLLLGIAIGLIQRNSPFFLLNTIVAHVPLWDWSAPPRLLRSILLEMSPLVVLAALGVWQRGRRMYLVIAYTIASGCLCTLIALRWGSDHNYFLEFAATIAMMAAAGIDVTLEFFAAAPRISQTAVGAVLAVALVAPGARRGTLAVGLLLRRDLGCPQSRCNSGWDPGAFQYLANINGPILTALPDINLQMNNRVLAPEFDVLRSMRNAGLFDDSELVGMISQKKVAAIVLDSEGLSAGYNHRLFFWPRLRLAIQHNYVRVPAIGPPYVLVPK